MFRFVLLALPGVALVFGFGAFLQDLLGVGVTGGGISGVTRLWEFFLESIAFTGLFLLVQGKGNSVWRDGLLTAGAAWVFRGALTVVTLARVTNLPRDAWVGQAYAWLVLYVAAGLTVGLLATSCKVRRP